MPVLHASHPVMSLSIQLLHACISILRDALHQADIFAVRMQEPDTYDIKWEVNGNKPALRPLYLNLMDVLFQINAGVPFMVQGTGQAALANWGDGFITDAKTLATYSGMSDPNLFFQQLLAKPYLRQVGLWLM